MEAIKEELNDDKLITVCDLCLQASCWQGIFMCENAFRGGSIQLTVRELKELHLEHPDYWK